MSVAKTNSQGVIVLWEAPKLIPPEFRLYYDDNGGVICYTSDPAEKREGKYIIIDKLTYAEGRYDVRVIDGKISKVSPQAVFYKLTPNMDEGTTTCLEDMSIIPDDHYKGKTIKWKMTVYEL